MNGQKIDSFLVGGVPPYRPDHHYAFSSVDTRTQCLMLDVMRTTLTLDDDVVASARALAAQRGVPIGTVISDLARRSLAPTQPAATRNGIRLFPVRSDAGPVTPELVKALGEDGR